MGPRLGHAMGMTSKLAMQIHAARPASQRARVRGPAGRGPALGPLLLSYPARGPGPARVEGAGADREHLPDARTTAPFLAV